MIYFFFKKKNILHRTICPSQVKFFSWRSKLVFVKKKKKKEKWYCTCLQWNDIYILHTIYYILFLVSSSFSDHRFI